MGQFIGLTAALWALAAGLAGTGAHAQGGMHKCVDIEARVSYQDGPCAAGTAMGEIARDTRPADPAALRQASADRLRVAQAAEARAGIRVSPDERKIIDSELQRYLAAAGRGDSEERCRLAGQIGAGLAAAKNQPGSRRWKLYADADCGEANKPHSALLPDAAPAAPPPEPKPQEAPLRRLPPAFAGRIRVAAARACSTIMRLPGRSCARTRR